MSVDLRSAATAYLASRRARGFRLAGHDRLIGAFVGRLDTRDVTVITVADAMTFAQQRSGSQHRCQQVLQIIRGFAFFVHNMDPPAAELIPAGLIRASISRRTPYLYSDDQIAQLMSRAWDLSPRLRAATMCTLIGLLAATGLHGGEAFTTRCRRRRV